MKSVSAERFAVDLADLRSLSPLILSLLRNFPGLLLLRQIIGDLHGVVHKRLLNVFIQLQETANPSAGSS